MELAFTYHSHPPGILEGASVCICFTLQRPYGTKSPLSSRPRNHRKSSEPSEPCRTNKTNEGPNAEELERSEPWFWKGLEFLESPTPHGVKNLFSDNSLKHRTLGPAFSVSHFEVFFLAACEKQIKLSLHRRYLKHPSSLHHPSRPSSAIRIYQNEPLSIILYSINVDGFEPRLGFFGIFPLWALRAWCQRKMTFLWPFYCHFRG